MTNSDKRERHRILKSRNGAQVEHQSVADFLKNGGKITKVKASWDMTPEERKRMEDKRDKQIWGAHGSYG